MAKKGNTVAEFRREEHVDDKDVDVRRRYYAVREDGKVLVKNQVHFREEAHRNPYWHDWGWKFAHHLCTGPKIAACVPASSGKAWLGTAGTSTSQRTGARSAAEVIRQIGPQLLDAGFERTK